VDLGESLTVFGALITPALLVANLLSFFIRLHPPLQIFREKKSHAAENVFCNMALSRGLWLSWIFSFSDYLAKLAASLAVKGKSFNVAALLDTHTRYFLSALGASQSSHLGSLRWNGLKHRISLHMRIIAQTFWELVAIYSLFH
jgi:hypothetical protein